MRRNEPRAELRRIPIQLEDGAGNPITGADLDGKISLSLSGAAPIAQAGTWTELGAGTYVYEATQPETDTDLFLLVMAIDASWRPFVLPVWIDDGLVVAQATAGKRRMPIWIESSSGLGVPGLALSGAEVQLCTDGVTFVNGTGAATEIGLGAYYYEATAAELVEGIVVLKVIDSGGSPMFTIAYDVAPGDAADPIAELVTPPIGAIASTTPLVIEVADDRGLASIAVFARFAAMEGRFSVFRRGVFQPGFERGSTIQSVAPGPGESVRWRLAIKRNGRWPAGTIEISTDLVDNSGNLDLEI